MKSLAGILGLALVASVIAAIHLLSEVNTQRGRNAEAVARISAAEAVQSSATSAPAPPAVLRAAPEESHAVAKTPAVSVPAAQGGKSGNAGTNRPNPMQEAVRQLQSSPQGQEMMRVMARQKLEEEYPDLAKEMNLSPEVAGKVLDLVARHRTEMTTAMLNAQPIRQQNQAYESELTALLGSSYPKWNEYQSKSDERQRAMYERMGQDQIRTSINSTGVAPLTDAQFQDLNTALAAEQGRIDRETTSPQQQMQRLPETNRRLIEVAATLLSPQQLEGYKRYLQQQEETIRMMDSMGAIP